jgi:hypothetical protein
VPPHKPLGAWEAGKSLKFSCRSVAVRPSRTRAAQNRRAEGIARGPAASDLRGAGRSSTRWEGLPGAPAQRTLAPGIRQMPATDSAVRDRRYSADATPHRPRAESPGAAGEEGARPDLPRCFLPAQPGGALRGGNGCFRFSANYNRTPGDGAQVRVDGVAPGT